MENLTFSYIAWDAWRATHGGPAAIVARQRRRLAELVAFARLHSRFYADKFRGLPEHVVQPLIRYEMGDSVTVNPAPCACGSPLPTIHVEGRDDEILRFIGPEGKLISVMPMALWSVIKDTPGVYRFQAIRTAPERLEVRLQAKIAGEEATVWEAVKQRAKAFLTTHGLANVNVERASEPPVPTRSGKFRHVWAELQM